MRIAHINNISGIASIIAEYQRTKRYPKSDVFVFNKIIHRQFGGTMINYWSPLSVWKLLRNLRKNYDLWHYHYPYGSLKKRLEERKIGKVYVKHYHGDDIRGKRDEDSCLVSTPDLLQYTPNGKWLPNPIDFLEIDNNNMVPKNTAIEKQKNQTKIVAHYPYYKNHSPNDDFYFDTLNRLQKEDKCKVLEILNHTHAKALQMMSSADIVIGKIMPRVGWFGKFELEGMALGKPVITYVSDELYEKYKPPICRTSKNTFKQDLENLLEDETEQTRLSSRGYTYVRKTHSMESISPVLDKYYLDNQ
jgi:hypothetical protein